MERLSAEISKVRLRLEGDGLLLRRELSLKFIFSANPLWLSYATRLDETRLMYVLPDMHQALSLLTGVEMKYFEGKIGDMKLYIIGLWDLEQPFGPFWESGLTIPTEGISTRAKHMFHFGEIIQNEILKHLEELKECYRKSASYLYIHRAYVLAVGRALGIDMQDHDLSKTNILILALGFLWHWGVTQIPRSNRVVECATQTVLIGHLQFENHHPQFLGDLDVYKMFADRISVHLQKDPEDNEGGWGIHPHFIPPECKDNWIAFKEKHRYINMYNVIKAIRWGV